ncbi:hypothetical protein STANM337S_02615 [Streptomyces tanashiensis]
MASRKTRYTVDTGGFANKLNRSASVLPFSVAMRAGALRAFWASTGGTSGSLQSMPAAGSASNAYTVAPSMVRVQVTLSETQGALAR